jgi:hypothetical protein
MLSGVDKPSETCYNININKGETISIHYLSFSMTQSVLIRCQPSLLEYILDNNFQWSYSRQFGNEEIDVVVDNIPYEVIDGKYEDPDEQLCEHYGIDYNLVNCIEAVD